MVNERGFFGTQPRPERRPGETAEEFANRLRNTSSTTGGGGRAPIEDLLDQLESFGVTGGILDTLKAGANVDAFGTRTAIETILASLQPPTDDDAVDASIFTPSPAGMPFEAAPTRGLDAGTLFPDEGAGPVAFGFPLFESTIRLLLDVEKEKRATLDQAIQTAGLLTELERVSPTRAASLSTRLGLPSRADFSFTEAFGRGAGPLTSGGGGRLTGAIGGQPITLPGQFSGQELAFLEANPNVGSVISDVADFLGSPDLIRRSFAERIPTSRALTSIAA